MMLHEICRPNPRGLGKKYRLMRLGDWTTNGFWQMRTEFEPKFIAKLKETNKAPENMLKLFEDSVKEPLRRLEVDYDHLDIGCGDPCLVMMDREKKYYVNAYYVSLFNNLNYKLKRRYTPPTEFFAIDEPSSFKPIIVKALGVVVGLIMPINK